MTRTSKTTFLMPYRKRSLLWRPQGAFPFAEEEGKHGKPIRLKEWAKEVNFSYSYALRLVYKKRIWGFYDGGWWVYPDSFLSLSDLRHWMRFGYFP